MLRVVRLLVLAALVASTGGCVLGEASRAPIPTRRPLPPGVVALPDYPPCEAVAAPGIPCVYAGHLVVGVLHERDACVWIATPLEAQVLWPFGYSARFDPFMVFDNAGNVVAREGDEISAEGWGPTPAEPDACGRDQQYSLVEPLEVDREIGG
jgi:hypothetical protein